MKDGFGMDEVVDSKLLRGFFDDFDSRYALMVGVEAISQLSSAGLLGNCPSLRKLSEMCLKLCVGR